MARKRKNNLSSLYELTDYLSKSEYSVEERRILYGKALYLAFANVYDKKSPILENLEITARFLYLLDLMNKRPLDFNSINKAMSSKLKKQSNRLSRLVKQDIPNEKVRRVIQYVGSNIYIQNLFKTIGDTLEDALASEIVRTTVEGWRKSNQQYTKFMLTSYKRGISIESSIRRIIETEMNQIDIYFRRYLNPS